MAATDLERFSVRAGLGRGARGGRGRGARGGAALQLPGREPGCQRRAAGLDAPRAWGHRSGLSAASAGGPGASAGAPRQAAGGVALLGRRRGRPLSREGACTHPPGSGQVRMQTGTPGAGGGFPILRTPACLGISLCAAGENLGLAGAVGWAPPVRMKP